MLNAHLRHAVRTELLQVTEQATGELPGARDVAVCFADLVGFTRMGEEVPPDELGAVAERLERLAADVVELPVRMVKTIGDAVMLVSSEVDPLIEPRCSSWTRPTTRGRVPPAARRDRVRPGAEPRGRLVRAAGEPGEPADRVARPGSVLGSQEVRDLSDGAGDGPSPETAGSAACAGRSGSTACAGRPDDEVAA